MFAKFYFRYAGRCISYICMYFGFVIAISVFFSVPLYDCGKKYIDILSEGAQIMMGDLSSVKKLSISWQIIILLTLVVKSIVEMFLIGTFLNKILSPENHIVVSDIGFVSSCENNLLLRYWIVRRINRFLYDSSVVLSLVEYENDSKKHFKKLWEYEEKILYMQGIQYLSISGKKVRSLLEILNTKNIKNMRFCIYISGHDERGRQFHYIDDFYIFKPIQNNIFYAPMGYAIDFEGMQMLACYLQSDKAEHLASYKDNYYNYNKLIGNSEYISDYMMVRNNGLIQIESIDKLNCESFFNRIWKVNQRFTWL